MLRRVASSRQPRTGNFKAAAVRRLLPSPSLCPGSLRGSEGIKLSSHLLHSFHSWGTWGMHRARLKGPARQAQAPCTSWGPGVPRVTPEESWGCLVAASVPLTGVRCPVQAWGGKSNSGHGIGTASLQAIIFLPLPGLSLHVLKPHLPQQVPQPSLFFFSPQRPQLNVQLEMHSNYSKTTLQTGKKKKELSSHSNLAR